MRLIYQDAGTGSMSVMTKIEPGATIPAHRHSKADETVFVLSGDFIEAGTVYSSGTFFFGKAGAPHGPHKSPGGCVVITTFSAPLDFDLV